MAEDTVKQRNDEADAAYVEIDWRHQPTPQVAFRAAWRLAHEKYADTIAALRRDLAASDAAMTYILNRGSLYEDHPLAECAERMQKRHRARQAAAAKEDGLPL